MHWVSKCLLLLHTFTLKVFRYHNDRLEDESQRQMEERDTVLTQDMVC